MKRFSYLVPRIIILMLVCTAVWLGKDSLLRRAAVHYGQQFANAKVEIGQLQTDLKNNRVLLKNVKIADSRKPMSNLFQADLAYLKLDPRLLWSRKFKVTEGQVHGLVVNAPRTESGAIDPTLRAEKMEPQADFFPEHALEKVGISNQARLKELSMSWLNQVDTKSTPSVTNSMVEALAEKAEAQWRTTLNEFKEQAAEIEPKLVELTQRLGDEVGFTNPLRDQARFEKSIKALDEMQTKSADLHKAIELSLGQLDVDMEEFDAAVKRDLDQIQRGQASNQFDEALISELLLSQEGNELVADVINWLTWFRDSLPESRPIDLAAIGQGSNLPLSESNSIPDFFIEKLELEGSGLFARQHLHFVGTAYNLSSDPRRISEPTRIDLKALGKGNVLINCIVDRTAGKNCDNLSIQFPELEFPNKQVGHEKCMLVTFGDQRRANANISLDVQGAEISGKVTLRYSQASLHVDSLNDLIGGDDIRLRINQGLSQLSQFQAEMAISGTLDNYKVVLNSDLGSQFAKVVDTAVIDRVSKQNQNLLQTIQSRSKSTNSLVRTEIRTELLQLSERLNQESVRIAELKFNLENIDNAGWSKLR